LPATARALDLPFGDGVTVPLYLLNQAAAQEVACVFNGEGGDQLFAGWTNKPLIAAGVYESPAAFTAAYLRTFHRLHGYAEATFASHTPFDATPYLAEALRALPQQTLLARLRRANLMLKGAQNIQPRATNLALAHGLKLRTPFCHKPLADWTFGVSDELFLQGVCEKYLLKRAVSDWLPSDVVWREKRGMGVPLTAWCLGTLWRTLGRWLDPKKLAAEGVFQPDLALRVAAGQFSAHIQGRRIGEILWLLLMWQLWQAEFAAPVKETFYHSFWLPPRWWQWKYAAS
jgi:asparagine synthase (glutamine-hydrolysing)